MEQLKIGDFSIEYELYRSKRAKKVCVTIKNKKVRVAVPQALPLEYGRDFAEKNKEWILEHYVKQGLRTQSPTKKYLPGEKFFYRGRNYPLKYVETSNSKPYAQFIGSRILVYVPPGLEPEKRSALGKRLIEQWYKNQAEKILSEQVHYYSKKLGITFNKLRIKDQKTRWGSCSTKGNINLNWRIIMAPNQVIAYIIIHELTHLIYMNHSPEFWKKVEEHMPDYRKWKKWLDDNGNQLYI
ncbi:MAG: M48 family metallopeptidase [Peptococcaceae bacterium]|nr:M48 family metallopeptidase [Peptococcaceae bacterium]